MTSREPTVSSLTHCLPSWVTDMTAWLHLAFHVGAGDPLSGPYYAFVASTLPTEPLPVS